MSYQEMEVDDNKNLEEASFFGSNTCATKNGTKRSSSFLKEIAAIVTEERGMPHTINLCRDC